MRSTHSDQAVKICLAVDYSFPLDLLVRTPKNLAWRLVEGDSFLCEVLGRGKVLYEKTNGPLGPQGRRRLPRRAKTGTNLTLQRPLPFAPLVRMAFSPPVPSF